jgi:hypothetical protein
MSLWRRSVQLAIYFALLVAVYFTVPLTMDLDTSDVVQLVISAIALGLLAFMVVWEIRQQLIDDTRKVDRLAFALVVAVLGFALGFYVMELRDPGQIPGLDTRLDSLYFTMTTLLTIGYGDIHAGGQLARGLVLVPMVFNVVIIATAASTLGHQIRSRVVSAEARRQDLDTQRKPT